MRIQDVENLLDMAKRYKSEGKFMLAAETALNAQRFAVQSRSKKAMRIAFDAHCVLAMQCVKAVTAADKSRAGQIKKESLQIKW